MYIFMNIEINEKLTDELQKTIDNMECAYIDDDWFTYGMEREFLDFLVKQICLDRIITKETGMKLLEKYK